MKMLNKGTMAFIAFWNLAKQKGYTVKVVGDHAFRKNHAPDSPYIKLWGSRNGKLQVFETGKGRYEVPL